MKIFWYFCGRQRRKRKRCWWSATSRPLVYEDYKIGVPFHGKYKEIFNSDREEFGGSGSLNPRVKTSKKEECDDRPDSIRIKVPAMGVTVFSCTRVAEPVSQNEKAKAVKKAAVKKSSGKKKGTAHRRKI